MKRSYTLCRALALFLCFLFIFLFGCNQPPMDDQPPEPHVMELEYKAVQKGEYINDDYFDWEKYGGLTPEKIENIEINSKIINLEYIGKERYEGEVAPRYVYTDAEDTESRYYFDEKGRLLAFTQDYPSLLPARDPMPEEEAINYAKNEFSKYFDISGYSVECTLYDRQRYYKVEFIKYIEDYAAADYVIYRIHTDTGEILRMSSANLGRVPSNLDISNLDPERAWNEVEKLLEEILISEDYSEEELQQFEHEITYLSIVPLSGDRFGLEYQITSQFMNSTGKYITEYATILVK